jgi:putative DNA primase/helicase
MDADNSGSNDNPPKDTPTEGDPRKHPMDIDKVWEVRNALWRSGFPPVPVYGHDKGHLKYVTSPGKQPAGGRGWEKHAVENPPRAVREKPAPNALNTGILCNGLRVFDLDIDDKETVGIVRSIIEGVVGKLPARYRENSAGITLICRASVGEPPKRVLTGRDHSKDASAKVEVLGHNNQFVAYGVHPSGGELLWENGIGPGFGVRREDLPAITEEQVDEIFRLIAPTICADPPTMKVSVNNSSLEVPPADTERSDQDQTADPADIAAALDVIPNNGAANWDSWKSLGMAVFRATGGVASGFDAWAAWSAKNPAYDHQACIKEWEAMRRSPPDRIGAGSVFKMAQDAQPGWRAPSWKSKDAQPTTKIGEGLVLPPGFEISTSGLHFREPNHGDDEATRLTFVAAPFEVLGVCQNGAGGDWGTMLRWTDPAGIVHEQIVPHRLFPGRSSGDNIAALLESGGLRCSAAPALLKRFLVEITPPRIIRYAQTAGWHVTDQGKPVYILRDGMVFGPNQNEVILHPDLRSHGPEVAVAGTLQEWQDHIACYAKGNDRLVLSVSIAFTGPLLAPANAESGGIHLVGKSRDGKTTCSLVGASVWGRPDAKVRQWRATANGLEGIARTCSDGILLLDEISQADGREAGDSIYMLANGMGKQRATVTGAAREIATWKLIFLTTGEIALETKMAEANRSAATGLHVRLVNLEADAGAGMGVFQDLHGKSTPAELADHLRAKSSIYFGVPIRAFLAEVVKLRCEDPHLLDVLVNSFRDKFRETYVPAGADPQVISVASRFSLIAAAGEAACAFGILPWGEGEAVRAAGECFKSWLATRGHAGAGEDEQAVAAVRRFIAVNGAARFADVDTNNEHIHNRAGWRKRNSDGFDDFLFQSDAWNEVFRGTNISPNRAAQALDTRGLLSVKHEGRLTARPTIDGIRQRVFWVSGRILSET